MQVFGLSGGPEQKCGPSKKKYFADLYGESEPDEAEASAKGRFMTAK